MILWTIQHRDAYEELVQKGVLRGNPMYIIEEIFKKSYVWMADQMKKRIGNPPAGVLYPVWAWYQWEGKRKRPDMRSHGRGWGEKGTPIVLLTIDVPDNCVLLSDFDYWHVVLNDGEIIFPYDESVHYSKEQRQKSWENIFDISCSFDGDKHHILSTQATMWEIKAEWVVKVEHFISR
ncbi:DUF3841 domain-containing protein [Velocimicrobium porci]|uniref:DUF3841 domain-containing protein n=1 Tax=Velocimicrobium porci TaxID=2606634 RepID=A0A6L5Y1E6_9FIRM|nr:DUF3841 domain-containing protein [Velocimicrobium porci]MSS64734.1 DUF3841 domain-containing protein [Velocimicrobium porci]